MRIFTPALAMMALALPAGAQEKLPADYPALSRSITEIVANKVPREFVDESRWQGSIPIPERLPFPRLKRTLIKVGDHYELPHGIWIKGRASVPEPTKNLTVTVNAIVPQKDSSYRVSVDALIHDLRTEVDLQHWQRGIATLGATANSRSKVAVALELDVKVQVDTANLLPTFKTEAKVASTKVRLVEFELFPPGPGLLGDGAQLNAQLQDAIQQVIFNLEPEIQARADAALAKSLQQDDQGPLMAAIMQSLAVPKK